MGITMSFSYAQFLEYCAIFGVQTGNGGGGGGSGITNDGIEAANCVLVSDSTTGAIGVTNFSYDTTLNNMSIGGGNTFVGTTSYNLIVGTTNSVSQSNYGFTFGTGNTISGNYGVALGSGNTITSDNSVVFGTGAISTFQGSFVFSDSTGSSTTDSAANQFICNFANGFKFYNGASNGVLAFEIDANQNVINVHGTADQSYSIQVPTNGFAITISAGVKTLALNPASHLATGQVTMPASPIDGQEIRILTTQNIYALSAVPNAGQTFANPYTETLYAGTGISWIYDLAGTTWFTLYDDAVGSDEISSLTALVSATTALNVTYSNGTAGVGATLTDASGTFAPLVLDGVAVSVGDTVVIPLQLFDLYQNGIYILTRNGNGSGTPWVLTRSPIYDTVTQMAPGQTITIQAGDTLSGNIYVMLIPQTVTIGTDPINFFSQLQLQPYIILGNPTGTERQSTGIPLGAGLAFVGGALVVTDAVQWENVATNTQALVDNQGYITNNGATLITYTLPATAAQGTVISIAGFSAGGWTIAQNASQQIIFGSQSTTVGTGGSISSINQNDQIDMLCVEADLIWTVRSALEELTII